MGRLALYRRFIDDILIIWKGNWGEVEDFMMSINNNQWGLSFTHKQHKSTIDFLDLTLIGVEGKIITKTYQKSVDVNGYLHARSGHHPTWIQNIPSGQFTRIRRNCSFMCDYEKEALMLSQRFVEKAYPLRIILEAYLKGLKFGMIPRSEAHNKTLLTMNSSISSLYRGQEHHSSEHFKILELLGGSCDQSLKKAKFNISTKEVGTGKTPIFSTTFNIGFDEIIGVFDKYWPILTSDPWLSFCISKVPRVTFRRAPNLKNILAPSKLHCQNVGHQRVCQEAAANKRCGHAKCLTCGFICHQQSTFSSFDSTEIFSVQSSITCNTSFVVYLLICPCGRQYVGQTIRPLKCRFREHRTAILRNDSRSPVARHFTIFHDNNPVGLKLMGIVHIPFHQDETKKKRELIKAESVWIFKLNSMSPNGLNEELELF
ncbi:Hypothetical predicted protein [Pelobates cultripes]|uniref:Helix-turn-helix domain-containing protein n=1 Tax=Pelobates cultripes TaxID=61616 RepID=A0AAD1S797_PELCU|nr:Hypothetical predicted protein [Pelobates cultripes]